MKSIPQKTETEIETTIKDNIEVKKNLKKFRNLKFLLIANMMITLITQMKMKDIKNNLTKK
jgi:hypothetical protein